MGNAYTNHKIGASIVIIISLMLLASASTGIFYISKNSNNMNEDIEKFVYAGLGTTLIYCIIIILYSIYGIVYFRRNYERSYSQY
jgi:hypothetical protein